MARPPPSISASAIGVETPLKTRNSSSPKIVRAALKSLRRCPFWQPVRSEPSRLTCAWLTLRKKISFFKIEAGIDEYELAGSPIARNNVQIFRINKAEVGDATGADPDNRPASPTYDLYLPLVNLGIDFLADGIAVNGNRYGSGELLRFAGVTLVALFCLWLLSLILRLVFRRPPKFEPWQPPYAVDNWHDPNSALGRRQSWQFHAQNSTISAAPAPNQVTVIKRLTDNAGNNLGGWKINAVRTAQYDIYGRISRNRSGHAAEDQQATFSYRNARAEHGPCRIAQGN